MQKLLIHPSLTSSSAKTLFVFSQAHLVKSVLHLQYKIQSEVALIWPAKATSLETLDQESRQDELWKTTCLEAFVLNSDGSYLEINLSPKSLWNAYRFDSYRNGMQRAQSVTEVKNFSQDSDLNSGIYQLRAEIELGKTVKSQNFRLGLTAVIETIKGEKSYWSLKHSEEKPDFHDSRGHILELSIRS